MQQIFLKTRLYRLRQENPQEKQTLRHFEAFCSGISTKPLLKEVIPDMKSYRVKEEAKGRNLTQYKLYFLTIQQPLTMTMMTLF